MIKDYDYSNEMSKRNDCQLCINKELEDIEKGKEEYSFEELYFGKVLMEKKDPIFIKKWENKYEKYQKYKNHKTDIEDLKIIEGMEKILCK